MFKLPIESLKSPLSNDITCSFKLFWKESTFSVGITVVWPETVRGCEQNSWFLYHEFKITNSFSRIKTEVVTSFLWIFMNSFTRTSSLFAKLRIYSYEFVRVSDVMLRMACTVLPSINFSKQWNRYMIITIQVPRSDIFCLLKLEHHLENYYVLLPMHWAYMD